MIVVDVIHLMIGVFLALAIWRYLQSKINSETTTGKALAWTLH